MSNGEWQTVVHRKRYPPHWLQAPNPTPTTNPNIPYKATYAQALASPPRPAANPPKANPPPKTQTNHTTPINPTATIAGHYTSPFAQLRFPPSPQFKEWRGRCFRCCRCGHVAAQCRNLRKCGRCWGDGHIGSRCAKTNAPATAQQAAQNRPARPVVQRSEPSFDELLAGPYPNTPKPMPEGRQAKTYCYVVRDGRYFQEMDRLQWAVVLYALKIEFDLSIDEVAKIAARTGLLKVEEVSIGVLTRSRYLISLSANLTQASFIEAILEEV